MNELSNYQDKRESFERKARKDRKGNKVFLFGLCAFVGNLSPEHIYANFILFPIPPAIHISHLAQKHFL